MLWLLYHAWTPDNRSWWSVGYLLDGFPESRPHRCFLCGVSLWGRSSSYKPLLQSIAECWCLLMLVSLFGQYLLAYPRSSSPGLRRRGEVTSGSWGWAPLRRRARHSSSPVDPQRTSTISWWQIDFFHREEKMKCVIQRLGTKWFCISDFGWRRWSPRQTACQGWRGSVYPPHFVQPACRGGLPGCGHCYP